MKYLLHIISIVALLGTLALAKGHHGEWQTKHQNFTQQTQKVLDTIADLRLDKKQRHRIKRIIRNQHTTNPRLDNVFRGATFAQHAFMNAYRYQLRSEARMIVKIHRVLTWKQKKRLSKMMRRGHHHHRMTRR
jgi:uncharacterized protein HemX